MPESSSQRLVVVSNRLPVSLERKGDEWDLKVSPGGLVTALTPVLHARGGLWVGWPGTNEEPGAAERLAASRQDLGYELLPIWLSPEERRRFYWGFSNQVIWPLFHDMLHFCDFDPAFWSTYEEVNRKFARLVVDRVSEEDFIWIHDFHLMNMGVELRRLGLGAPLHFFLHTPFPPLDTFLRLPWRHQIMNGLLHFDLLGFQTPRDTRNFLQCVQGMAKEADFETVGSAGIIRIDDREVKFGCFPVGLDYKEAMELATGPMVSEEFQRLRASLPPRCFLMGIDRLDYTKGIPSRFEAFRKALDKYPEMRERVSLIQVASPSRTDIPKYNELKDEVERLVGEINGFYTERDWVPIRYLHRTIDQVRVYAYFRLAQIALITPLKDGLNLVAKEFCAAKFDDDGVLILSEFAGAATQLQDGALLVNPYDTGMLADAMHEAFVMTAEERRRRMKRLRKMVESEDVFWWIESFLRASTSADLASFPHVEDYVPQTYSD